MLLLGLVALMLLPAAPAAALHQYCGEDATGVHLGGYPGETKDNGHPDGMGDNAKYAGRGAIGPVKKTAFALHRIEAGLGLGAKAFDTVLFTPPTKGAQLGINIAKLVAGLVTTAMDAALLAVEQRAAEVNACNDVLAGDTIDLIFTTLLQEELANLDPADGTVTVPTSLFLLPDDNAPHWTSHDAGTGDLADDQPLSIPYVDGFADTSKVGVAHVVRNTIAHLELHGMCTTGGMRWDPEQGFVDTDSAADLWWDAVHYLEDGRVREAHHKFAEAYRSAVTAPVGDADDSPPTVTADDTSPTVQTTASPGDHVSGLAVADADDDDLHLFLVDDHNGAFGLDMDAPALTIGDAGPPMEGSYEVDIAVSDGCGETGQATTTVTVEAPDGPTPSASPT